MIKAKNYIGILKHLPNFYLLNPLDEMYNALVRTHLDYCDTTYRIPPVLNQPPHGLSLNISMEKVERILYQAALALTGT